jgi:hypothetical protein
MATAMVALSMLAALPFSDDEKDFRDLTIQCSILTGFFGLLPFVKAKDIFSMFLEFNTIMCASMFLLLDAVPSLAPVAGTATLTATTYLAESALNRYRLWKSPRAESFGISVAPAFFIAEEKVQPDLQEHTISIAKI